VKCPECKATVSASDEMCGQCHTWLPHYEPPPIDAVVRERVSEALAVKGPAQYSRWQRSEVSLGPVARVLLTLLLLAVGAALIWFQNPLAIGIWWLLAVPLGLRSVWARQRVG
jgi:hypothetical protein